MQQPSGFAQRLATYQDKLSPAEQRVARFFEENREEVLIASASKLAKQVGASDATVIRTARALGFDGLEDLRRSLAREIRETASPATRMARTLKEAGRDMNAVLSLTLDINRASLDGLQKDISPDMFGMMVETVVKARRVFIFGIGPSSAMADYFAIGLSRLGFEALCLTQTGLLLADQIQKFRPGDALVIFAYGRVYQELNVLLDQADLNEMPKLLISDTLGARLHQRVDLVLPVARGRVNMLSMHSATLALIESVLVGVAMKRPAKSIASLENLNRIRAALSAEPMDLPTA